MGAEVIPINRNIDQAWQDYLAAMDRAQQTRSIEDGIAFGKAQRRWLDLFLTDDQRRALGGRA